MLSCILGVLPADARSEFYDSRMETDTSSLSGRASRNGDKCSLRTFERREEHSRVTKRSEDPLQSTEFRRITLFWLSYHVKTPSATIDSDPDSTTNPSGKSLI